MKNALFAVKSNEQEIKQGRNHFLVFSSKVALLGEIAYRAKSISPLDIPRVMCYNVTITAHCARAK